MKKKIKLLLFTFILGGFVGGIVLFTIDDAQAEETVSYTDYKDGKCEGNGNSCKVIVYN